MRTLLKTTYYAVGTLLFLLIALAGFTQTRLFRSYLHDRIVALAVTDLHGNLELGSLEGNLITGFHVNGVTFSESGGTVLHAERLEATYDPLELFVNRLTINNLKLLNARILLSRGMDSTWNVSRIIPPPSTTSTSGTSTLALNFKNIELLNAEVILRDSVKLRMQEDSPQAELPSTIAGYPTLTLRGVNLTASVKISPKEIAATIHRLSFKATEPALTLSELSGEFLFSAAESRVKKLSIETPDSRLTLNAQLKDVNLLAVHDLSELEHVPVSLTLSVGRLSFTDVRKFFPADLNFLDREVGMQLKVSGTVGKLRVENLVVQSPHSYVKAEGNVGNILRPDDLDLDLLFVNNKIDANEIRQFLPRLGIPDIHGIGELTYNLRFNGKPSAFHLQFEGSSDAGHVGLDGTFEQRGNAVSYTATAKTSQLDIGLALNNNSYASKLNSTLTLKGSGTEWRDLNGSVRIDIDSSQFSGMSLVHSHIASEVAGRTMTANILLNSGRTQITVNGSGRFNENTPNIYRVEGKASSLNLASILKKPHYESDLSFDFTAEGRGISFDRLQSTVDLKFAPSSFGDEEFSDAWFRAELNAVDASRQTAAVTSTIADVSIEGTFTLPSVISALEQGGILIGEAVGHRIRSLDSLQSTGIKTEEVFKSSLQNIPAPVAARIELKVKDLYPLGVFLGSQLAGRGTISGELVGDLDHLRFNGSTTADFFQYADSSFSLGLSNATLLYQIQGMSRTSILDSVQTSITFNSAEARVNKTFLSQPELSLTVRGTSGTFDLRALADSTLGFAASGSSLYKNGFITYTMNKLQLDAQSYRFLNVEPVVLRLGRNGVEFEHFWMRHDAQELLIAGSLEPAGHSSLNVDVRNFSLNNLSLFSRNTNFVQDVQDFEGVVHGRAVLRGSVENPDISLDLAAYNVQYGNTPLGQVGARISYGNRLLNLLVSLRSKQDDAGLPPDFLVSGSLPYALGFTKASSEPLHGEMDVNIQSKGVRLELIDPFINEISNLTGMLVCDMKLRGTVDEPRYEGSMGIQSARFLFKPLGIMYRAEGQVKPVGERIALENVIVQNIESDKTDGLMRFSGSFALQGLKLSNFDLVGNGQLLVMKESARQPGQSIYGDFFAATGVNGLSWRGTPQRSVVSGELRIKSANLTLPPTRDQLLRSAQDVTITAVNDTAIVGNDETAGKELLTQRTPAGSTTLAMNSTGPIMTGSAKEPTRPVEEKDERSFLDRLVYDLDIETQGPTLVRFVFNPYIGEELYADLKGRMSFTKDGQQTRLTGEVEVGDRSYYNFLKRFQARGRLTFTGDPLNPELAVRAEYAGIHQNQNSRQPGDTTRTSSNSTDLAAGNRVIVILNISGTRREPKPSFEIEEVQANGEHVKRTTGDVESDAISFILTGSFHEELTYQDRSSLLGNNLIYGLTSSVLSEPITDFIRKEFGFISSVDVIYYGGNVTSSTDLRVTGEIGEAVVRFGGRVLNDISNANASVQLPLGGVLGSEKWRNLMIEVERRVEGVESYEQRKESTGVRLIYRFTF